MFYFMSTAAKSVPGTGQCLIFYVILSDLVLTENDDVQPPNYSSHILYKYAHARLQNKTTNNTNIHMLGYKIKPLTILKQIKFTIYKLAQNLLATRCHRRLVGHSFDCRSIGIISRGLLLALSG